MREDREWLLDIQEAIERIERHVPTSRELFDRDELVQVWMLHALQVIGEAGRKISSEFRARHTDVPWTGMIGMRTILVHHYFDVDQDAVWQAVTVAVPKLKQQIQRILETEHWADERDHPHS